MAKLKRTKWKTLVYKKLYRKLKIEQQESYLKPGRNSVDDNLSL
jgi:hypothetical protein